MKSELQFNLLFIYTTEFYIYNRICILYKYKYKQEVILEHLPKARKVIS